MNIKSKFMRLYLCIAFFLSFYLTAVSQVAFLNTTYGKVFAEAQLENKEVLVNVFKDNCSYCQQMDSTIYADSSFGDFINSKFLSLNINSEAGFGIDFAMKYRIKTVPQLLFFDQSGHLLYRWIGVADKDTIKNLIVSHNSTYSYLDTLPYPLNFSLDYPEFYRNTFKKRPERSFPTDTELATFMASCDSITDEVTWGVLTLLVTNPAYADSILKYHEILTARFGKSEVEDKLHKYVYAQVKEAIKDKNEGELNDALRKADVYFGNHSGATKLRYQLYYYQMTRDWSAYSEMGEQLMNDTSLYNPKWLTEIAQTLYRNTDNTEILLKARDWMKPIESANPSYHTTGTIAWLDYKLGNKKQAEKKVETALNWAQEENIEDTTEIEALQKMLKLAE